MNKTMSWLTILALVLGFAGCAEEQGDEVPGVLALSWAAGPAGNCEAVGLDHVEVSLARGATNTSEVFSCAEELAFLTGLRPGSYQVSVVGLEKGQATFEAEVGSVEIEEGEQVDIGEVRLVARPAQVELLWYFSNGRLCAQNSVESVVTRIYDANYYDVGVVSFSCDEGGGVLLPLEAGGYVLEVMGLSAQEQEMSKALIEIEVGRGEEALVEVALGPVYE